ncbi:MAG: hypothetical protein ACLKAM_10570 [Alkaliphilus sp.]
MKKMFTMLLVFCLVFSASFSAFASLETKSEEKEFYASMQSLARKHNFEIVDFESVPSKNIIHFETIEEVEIFIELITKKQIFTESIFIENPVREVLQNNTLKNSSFTSASSRIQDDSHVIKWWSPFSGWGQTGWYTWKNISFEYTYDFLDGNPRFLSISNINSYLTGIHMTTWHAKTTDDDIVTKVNHNDTVTFNIKGVYVLGIVVDGYPIGARTNGEWEASLLLH